MPIAFYLCVTPAGLWDQMVSGHDGFLLLNEENDPISKTYTEVMPEMKGRDGK